MIYHEFFRREFLRKSKEVNLIEELLKLFSDITADEVNLIKHGSYVAIKHATTGKYLSSASGLNYETGSRNQAVSKNDIFKEICYYNLIYLFQLFFNRYLLVKLL